MFSIACGRYGRRWFSTAVFVLGVLLLVFVLGSPSPIVTAEVNDPATLAGGDDVISTITNAQLNQPPTAGDNDYDMVEDKFLQVPAPGVLADDSDPDNDTLTAVLDTPPIDGAFVLHENGSFYFSPPADFYGYPFFFTYHAFDGQLASNTAIVRISVAAVNDAPQFTANDPPQVAEDAGPQTAVVASDFNPGSIGESGQAIDAYIASDVENGGLLAYGPNVNIEGKLIYTPVPNAFGVVTFHLQVRDTGGTANGGINISEKQPVKITILPVNDLPEISVDQLEVIVKEGQNSNNSGTYVDVDKTGLAFSASVGTVIDNGDETWCWCLAEGDGPFGSQTVTVTVEDSQDTASVSFALIVVPKIPSALYLPLVTKP